MQMVRVTLNFFVNLTKFFRATFLNALVKRVWEMFVYYNSADDKSRGEELFLTHTKVSVHVICIISEPGEGTYRVFCPNDILVC